MEPTHTPTAIITGASRGLGRALVNGLVETGYRVIATARTKPDLLEMAATRIRPDAVVAIAGDVSDHDHQQKLVAAAGDQLRVLVNNASTLGPSPLPRLESVPLDAIRQVYDVNVLAPLALTQLALPGLRSSAGTVVNITSDAALGDWPGWGVYGSSKAALDQWTAVIGEEIDDVRFYSFDPGDMRTRMHAEAFPGEDISDRPEPETVIPALLHLIGTRPASGRYLASSLTATVTA